MALPHILVFFIITATVGVFVPRRWLGWILLIASVVSIFWLQPATPVRNLDFWFPTASIVLAILAWAVTRSSKETTPADLASALVVLGVILAIGLTRYLGPLCCLTPSRPPEFGRIALVLGLVSMTAVIPARLFPHNRILVSLSILFLIGLFFVLKTSSLGHAASAWLRGLAGQPAVLASALDLRWLGFSYLAFRLIHALRDHQAGMLPPYSLSEFITYAVFFPAYTAGPIDRSQHFIGELRQAKAHKTQKSSAFANLSTGSQRILLGIFKKFVLADSLALIALNSQNAVQTSSGFWMWVMLYAYTLRIYFDFAGYTDIAIGFARLLGIKLPENFDRPYLKQNLTAFWNSWHITLASWFRAYFFNPVTRTLRSQPHTLPTWAIIFIGQFGTMLLIGMWHGITWTFLAWGAWHAFGLFAHNRWTGWIHPQLAAVELHPLLRRTLNAASWLITFHYVALGWVWFALPTPSQVGIVLARLFGR